jgi:glycosyltransferase involved in cell wall biosynthesis
MEISFVTNMTDISVPGGYNSAGFGIVNSLQNLGHRVLIDSPAPDFQLNFCFPSFFADSLRRGQYQAFLAVWESTLLKPDWYDIVKEVDELWVASEWCQQIYEDNGFKVTKVYPHGLDPVWKPHKRTINNKVRFLYEGGASRKNPQLVFDAFKTAFGDSNEVELIMKEKYQSSVRLYQGQNIIGVPNGNVKVVAKMYEEEQMVQLFNMSHCLVSASSGEGFSLPPLQMLGTGAPAIATEECIPYSEYLGGLGIKSTYVDSPWPEMHPGKVLKPDFDDLVDKFRYIKDNIETLLPQFYKQSFVVHEKCDWNNLTEAAFSDIVEKFG